MGVLHICVCLWEGKRGKEGQKKIWTEGEGEERGGGEGRPRERGPQDVNSVFIVFISISIKELKGKVTKKEEEN